MTQIIRRPFDPKAASRLAGSGIPPLLARIYAARGIEQAAQLETGLHRLLPYPRLKYADRMAALLADAIAAQKKILIVADYDADGATACAVAMRGLGALGARVDFIVPNRFEYGYGLTPEIVRFAAELKPDILLTVDNGIASVEGVAEAHRLGMQVLVTDHHLPGDALPDAECIVNPNQPGCDFPSKNLAGVGVMFYVLMALRAEMRARGAFANNEGSPTPSPVNPPSPSGRGYGVRNERGEPNLGDLLDLVALGTVADVVRLDDNNRILVQQGLLRIRAGRSCAGIQALLRTARRPAAQASTYELGFIIGPRLNAAGRLEDMSLGIRCLLADDADEAAELAAQLDTLNQERRSIEADMQESALAALEGFDPAGRHAIALFRNDWHQGVIGILASRIKDRFHRPTIAFAHGNPGELKGSGRSIPGLHLRDALDLVSKRHPKLILKFGGHAMAAGLSIPEQALEDFQEAFEQVVRESLTPDALVRNIATDGILETHELSLDMARALQAQVWGQGFPEPLFEDEFRVLSQRVVGEKHLKLKLASSSGSFDAIRFFHADAAPDTVHAVYSLGVNEYNGSESLQLIVRHW